jgi:hypothetical protein
MGLILVNNINFFIIIWFYGSTMYKIFLHAQNQLIYNVRRGILEAEDKEVLFKKGEQLPASSKRMATPSERPVTEPAKEFKSEEAIEEDLKGLRKLLKGPVASIQRKATDLRGGQIRKLLELEKVGKARVSLTVFLEELISKYSDAVTKAVGQEDLQATLPQVGNLSQVSDVVESEHTEIELDQKYEALNPLPKE